MAITATYHRYYNEYSEEFDSVEDAVSFLAEGEDAGALSSASSEIRDGDRVISGYELDRLVSAAWSALA